MFRGRQKWGAIFCGCWLIAGTALGESHSGGSEVETELPSAEEKQKDGLDSSPLDGLFNETQLQQIQKLRAQSDKKNSATPLSDKELHDVDDLLKNVAETGDVNEGQAKELKALLAMVEEQRRANKARQNLAAKEVQNDSAKGLDEKSKSLQEKMEQLKQTILPYAQTVRSVGNSIAPAITQAANGIVAMLQANPVTSVANATVAPTPLVAMARDLHFSPSTEFNSAASIGPVGDPTPDPVATDPLSTPSISSPVTSPFVPAPSTTQSPSALPGLFNSGDLADSASGSPSDVSPSSPAPASAPSATTQKSQSPGVDYAKTKNAPVPTSDDVAPDAGKPTGVFQLALTAPTPSGESATPSFDAPQTSAAPLTKAGPYNPPIVSALSSPVTFRDPASIPATDDGSSSESPGTSDLEKVLARAAGRAGYSARKTSGRTAPTTKSINALSL